jgi:molybdate transport system regulatory protein
MYFNNVYRLKFKIWIEKDSNPIIGKGGIQLLKAINEKGSIAQAAKELGMSYKFAWQYVRKINKGIGGIDMKKGGRGAGGSIISEKLIKLIELYEQASKEIEVIIQKYEKILNEIL